MGQQRQQAAPLAAPPLPPPPPEPNCGCQPPLPRPCSPAEHFSSLGSPTAKVRARQGSGGDGMLSSAHTTQPRWAPGLRRLALPAAARQHLLLCSLS